MTAAGGVSVVVPVGPDRRHLPRLLDSLDALSPGPLEVVLVLDGAGARPMSGATTGRNGLRLVETPTAGGPAAARNAGARAARGDILLFLDADVTVPPDLPSRVARIFEEDPSLTAVIGSYDDAPGARGFVSTYRNLLHHHVHQSSRRDASTFWGACGAIRRDAFMAAGGFDERYRSASVEDIELGYRLTDAGHRIRLDPTLQVRHWKRWTLVGMVATDVTRRAWPWSLLLLRRGSARADLNLGWRDRLAVASVWGAVLALTWAAVATSWAGAGLTGSGAAAGGIAAALLALAAGLDARLHAFLLRTRGALFALGAVPMRWLFHLYSGGTFAVALAWHLVGGRDGRETGLPVPTTTVPERVQAHAPAIPGIPAAGAQRP